MKTSFRRQRGVGSLVIALILLFSMSMIAFFVSKSLIFEQRTSANQYRSTKAFEAADAGIEWATAMLNDIRFADNACVPLGAGATQSFRTKYLAFSSASGFTPVSTVQPGCRISVTAGVPALNCACPAAGNAALASATDPTFTVKFEAVNSTTLPNGTPDAESVLVTSYGCTSADPRCVPGATGTADGYQKISVILKLKPSISSVPAATITTGGSLKLTSSASTVFNNDAESNGLLVDAGAGINNVAVPGCTGSFKDFANTPPKAGDPWPTLPGTPWQNAMVQNDGPLAALSANADAMFQAYFGSTILQFKQDRSTQILSNCSPKSQPYSDYVAAYNQGFRAFYTDCDFDAGGNLGSLADPVVMVTTGELKFNGGESIFGMVYGDRAIWDQVGLGNGSITGALVVRGSYCANANATYSYNGDALKKIRGTTGVLVRVPGSWKDF